MRLFPDSVILETIGWAYIVGVALATLYWHLTSRFIYWKEKGVHFLPPEPFFGNVRNMMLLRTPIAHILQQIYQGLDGHRFGGYYAASRPVLMLRDPELIQQITVKDFQSFHDRGYPVNEEADPLSGHLFNLGGSQWKLLRAKLTPTFTTSKMKMMFPLMNGCGNELQKYLKRPAKYNETLEMKEIMAKYTTDIIGTCAFGLKLNSMKNPNSEFRVMGRKLFEAPSMWTTMKWWVSLVAPWMARYFNVSLATSESREFFLKAVKDTVEYREKNNVVRNDFMNLLIQLKNKGRVDEDEGDEVEVGAKNTAEEHIELTDNRLAAQAFVFFVAGFETSSTTLSFCLHELAVNPEIQVLVRAEVDAVLEAHSGELTYEAVQHMDYLDRVVAETLRKYPPLPNLARMCTLPYTLPGTTVQLDVGTRVVIPVYAIHHDPRYYPNPDRFDPERFSEENKKSRPHGTYLPFGEGPRKCIGMRFAMMQIKIGLALILSSFEVEVCNQTVVPAVLDPAGAMTTIKGGTWLGIAKRPEISGQQQSRL